MIRIIHVSDLHFHKDNDDNKNSLALLSEICARYSFVPNGVNYLLVTGDIVDDGTGKQRAKARPALEPFQDALLIAPGNHDYGPLGNLYDPKCATAFDRFIRKLGVHHSYKQKRICVRKLQDGKGSALLTIGLNSNLETTAISDFAQGGLGESQLDALDKVLGQPEYRDMRKLVYLHHRPEPCEWYLALTDTSDLMAVVNNRVDALCFGHSGSTMKDQEPPQARMMYAARRKYGVPYLLNANASRYRKMFYEITVDKSELKVDLKEI